MLFGLARELSDDDLVRRFLAGDRQAFSQIVRRYQDRVYGLCYRWLGDPATAEELTQDIFIALFKSMERFRGESSFATWVFRISVNHCKNRRLYQKRRAWDRHEPLEGTPQDDGPVREIPAPSSETDGWARQEESSTLVHQALEALQEEHRQIIILRDIEDLDYEEIADVLDVPRGTVKSRLHRARAELAKVLRNRLGTEVVKG